MGAEDLSVAPEHCIVFEDAVAGIQSGNAAGMFTIGIGEQLVLNEADIVIKGFDGISVDDLFAKLT